MKSIIGCVLIMGVVGVNSCASQNVDDNIVIVNVGMSNRVALAKAIRYLSSMGPKVMAIDIEFSEGKEFYEDSVLMSSLNQCKKLVSAVVIDDYPNESQIYSELVGTLPEFQGVGKAGFVNLLFENDQFETLKRFSTNEKIGGKVIYPFGVQIAMEADSQKTVSFLKNHPKFVDVHYIGDEKAFKTVSYFQLINKEVAQEDIHNKIVLLGFLGLYNGYDGEFDTDKFFSPLNNKIAPYKPDMYGVVYHSNIVAQILNEN